MALQEADWESIHKWLQPKRSDYWVEEPSLTQKVFLKTTAQEVLFGGAAGGGKSSALLMAALQYVDVPNYSAILFRRTYADLALPGAFMDRFRAAANAGFSAVEFWDYQDQKRDVNQIAKLCNDLKLSIIQFTAWQGPSLALTDNHKKFKEAIIRAIDTAITLGAPMFTVVGHQTTDKYSQKKSVKNYMDALASVKGILEESGKTMIIEPFNPVDHEGHFLNGSKDTVSICRAINSPNIKINWDLYHMQLTEGNLIDELKSGFDQVGYIQIADVPGRNQPGTGELNYNFIFKECIDKSISN